MAYVYDEDGRFARRCHGVTLELSPLAGGSADEALVLSLLEEHERYTRSVKARSLREAWGVARARFVKAMPREYREALAKLEARQALA